MFNQGGSLDLRCVEVAVGAVCLEISQQMLNQVQHDLLPRLFKIICGNCFWQKCRDVAIVTGNFADNA